MSLRLKVFLSSPMWGLWPDFSLCLDTCFFIVVGRNPLHEDESVRYQMTLSTIHTCSWCLLLQCIVIWRLKTGIVEPEETFIARQRLGKHVSGAMNTQATMEVLLETVGSAPSLYNDDPRSAELTIKKSRVSWGLAFQLWRNELIARVRLWKEDVMCDIWSL
jgi:hypothetical protein